MPELAEIEYFRKQWNPGIGLKVRKVLTHPKARVFRESTASRTRKMLTGQVLLESMAHGKKLCFRFSDDTWLGLHLGMSGSLLAAAPEIVPGRHEHLVLVMDATALVFSDYRMFGGIKLSRGSQLPPWWDNLPPQPQEDTFTKVHFRKILNRHQRRSLKALLLDQDFFPGIGNWMADEILWRSRIHPARRPADLSSYSRNKLFSALKEVCNDAMEIIGSDWGKPPDTWLFNHRWTRSGTCPISGKPLEWITVGGRTSCFSPVLQK